VTACVMARLRLHVRQPVGIVECRVFGRRARISVAQLPVDGRRILGCVVDCRASLCVKTRESAALRTRWHRTARTPGRTIYSSLRSRDAQLPSSGLSLHTGAAHVRTPSPFPRRRTSNPAL